jgi:NADH-quinone oxidoreductase subunit A
MLYFEPLYGLFVHTAVSTALCLVIFLAVYFVNTATPSHEKNEGYECGFKAVDVTYTAFDVQFYRIGVLFLLFDVEILFFFPWILNFYKVSTSGHLAVAAFAILLFFGFIYELVNGALIWYPQPYRKSKAYRDVKVSSRTV